MEIFRYRFPAFGEADGMPNFTATLLEDKLNNGQDNVENYYIFMSKDKVVGRVSAETDVHGNMTAVNLFTVDRVRKGMEDSLMECVQKNLAAIAWENYDDPHTCVILDGVMESIGPKQKKFVNKDWEDDFARAVNELPYGETFKDL